MLWQKTAIFSDFLFEKSKKSFLKILFKKFQKYCLSSNKRFLIAHCKENMRFTSYVPARKNTGNWHAACDKIRRRLPVGNESEARFCMHKRTAHIISAFHTSL